MTTPNSNESDDSLDTNKDGEGSVSAAQNEKGNADELLSISLIEKLKRGSDTFSVHRCIYKIPNVLRKQNEKAFIPSVVSIGPFHHGKENLKGMENPTNGVLEIPPILVLEENRESLFGNLIAYEQCQPSLGYQITSYVVVLDNLIKSNKDVEFLVEKKIMRKILSKDVACFFSRVYKDNRLYNFEYLELQKQVNTFCAGGWHKWKMILRRYYFKNPCSSCSSSS
ncbi:hypothetical protein CerSpe_114730 [Prunus speciosa]